MPSPATPRLALFSGLGIDHALYNPQRHLPGVRVEMVPWLPTDPAEELRHYAHRLAATIEPPTETSGPLFLGGVSFGAMLAIEAAAIVRPAAVFNIAGAWDGRSVAPIVRITCRAAGGMSDGMIRTAFSAAGLFIRMTGRPDRTQREFLLGLARRALPPLTRWGCGAMLAWRAPSAAEIGCPVHHIHGSDDHLIPLANVRDGVDVVVPGGGHVINVTHADVVNRFVLDRIFSQAGGSTWTRA